MFTKFTAQQINGPNVIPITKVGVPMARNCVLSLPRVMPLATELSFLRAGIVYFRNKLSHRNSQRNILYKNSLPITISNNMERHPKFGEKKRQSETSKFNKKYFSNTGHIHKCPIFTLNTTPLKYFNVQRHNQSPVDLCLLALSIFSSWRDKQSQGRLNRKTQQTRSV